MDREEKERRRHVRHWATFMIMHLEGREGEVPDYSYQEALKRLGELVAQELERTAPEPGQPVQALTGT